MAPVRTKPIADLDIQQWVRERYGFAPHPYWISHCRELFLETPEAPQGRKPWHDCPPDKREAIRDAFLQFGLIR